MRAIRYIAAAAALAMSGVSSSAPLAGSFSFALPGPAGPINRRGKFKGNRRSELKRNQKARRR